VDREKILAWNPDFIFVDAGSRSVLDPDFEKKGDFYRMLGAARSGKTYALLPYNYYNTNIELALINAYFIAGTLYPERFKDLDQADQSARILAAFLGVRPRDPLPACHKLVFPETGQVRWE
jgi:iron complex transport system substrate-binding protein